MQSRPILSPAEGQLVQPEWEGREGRSGGCLHPSWALGLPTPATAGSILSPEGREAARASWAQGHGGLLLW